jgi:hypothetical protein
MACSSKSWCLFGDAQTLAWPKLLKLERFWEVTLNQCNGQAVAEQIGSSHAPRCKRFVGKSRLRKQRAAAFDYIERCIAARHAFGRAGHQSKRKEFNPAI